MTAWACPLGQRRQQPAGPSLAEAATNSHVIEGVIVDRDAGPSRAQRRARRRQQWAAARAALTHPAVRGGGRQLVYLALGLRVVGRRLLAVPRPPGARAMMRTAVRWQRPRHPRWSGRSGRRSAGSSGTSGAWNCCPRRWTPPARSFAGTVGGAFLLLVAGIALWVHSGHIADVATPFTVTAAVVKTIADIVRVIWRPLIALALLASMLGLWQAGRNDREALPMWLAPAGELPAGPDASWITPSIVVVAMRDLGIAELRNAIEAMGDGAGDARADPHRRLSASRSTSPCRRGRHRRDVASAGATWRRTWAATSTNCSSAGPPDPRTVRLWIADSGALDEPIGPSPLVTDPSLTANCRPDAPRGARTCAATRRWSACTSGTC